MTSYKFHYARSHADTVEFNEVVLRANATESK